MTSIALIGPGRHGTAIARLFASHGVDVVLYHHNPAKADSALDAVSEVARNATVTVAPSAREAAAGQQVVALTTLWDAPQRAVIGELGNDLAGKIVLDVSNPLDVTPRGVVARRPKEGSAGQFVATLLPAGAGHAKAFSNLATDFINDGADRDPKAVLPFLTDGPETTAVIRDLLARTGWAPRFVGGIDQSAQLEIGGRYNVAVGGYGRARLTSAEFGAHFGPEPTPSVTGPENS